jgi:hypothetical protein
MDFWDQPTTQFLAKSATLKRCPACLRFPWAISRFAIEGANESLREFYVNDEIEHFVAQARLAFGISNTLLDFCNHFFGCRHQLWHKVMSGL